MDLHQRRIVGIRGGGEPEDFCPRSHRHSVGLVEHAVSRGAIAYIVGVEVTLVVVGVPISAEVTDVIDHNVMFSAKVAVRCEPLVVVEWVAVIGNEYLDRRDTPR